MTKLFIAVVLTSSMLFCISCQTDKSSEKQASDKEFVKTPQEIDRYCLAIDLIPDSELMNEYTRLHSPEGMWPEIPVGIRAAGCLDMEIYLINNHMFMIVEVPKGADLDKIWENMGQYERQAEWGEFMLNFQQALPGHGEDVKWILMDKVYDLNDYIN